MFQSDFAKTHEAIGEARGVAIGEARGVAMAVITLLEARGVALTSAQRDMILGETDRTRLDDYLRRAVTVDSAVALLAC